MKKLALIIFTFFCLNSFALDVKILTWNIYMLPKPIHFSYQAERTRLITDVLKKSEYDLIFLQEAFPGYFHSHIFGLTKKVYPYQYYHKRPFFSHTVFGSGVYVLSRFPIKSKNKLYYDACRGADCFAAKGLLLATFELPGGKEIQIGNTHLQAGKNAKSSGVRLKQLAQVKKLLTKHAKPDVPQIVLGDINIDVKDEDFAKALNILNMISIPLEGDIDHTNGFPISCYSKPGDDVKEWIDHILISRESAIRMLDKRVKAFTGKIYEKECPLSDHYAVEATLKL